MIALPWFILFLPLAAAVLITLRTRPNRVLSAGLSTFAVVTGFVLAAIYVGLAGWKPEMRESSFTWLSVGDLHIELGLRLDPLSLMMLLVVTGVGGLIHIYSWGYMKEDDGFSRFFACLSLFTFSMLGIVLSNNLIELFIFWELVGVSSYLLIGYWFGKPAAADAGKKAFITNRLGDFGFILGILTVWSVLGTLNFSGLETALGANRAAYAPVATMAGLLIFCGAMGKSAQFPLHVWLPDAMEGPTPVSALIHAATMVAAGVYMLCRVFFLLNPNALLVIAWIGGITAALSAVIAVQQDDIKRILAYSTLSQLGYMVMGVGVAGPTEAMLPGPTEAMFHLTTHAFFKALLFLGAGSVILAVHHEQDIWKMGGLRNKMPVTYWTMLAGTLALAGIWPMSGFFSKDSLLARAEQKNMGLFILGVVVSALTAFYMGRLLFVVFFGADRSKEADHAKESAPVILWPLRILGIMSIIGGILGIEEIYRLQFEPIGSQSEEVFGFELLAPFLLAPVPAAVGLAVAGAGLFAAWRLYGRAEKDPLPAKLGVLSKWMRNRFYIDEFYQKTVIRLHDALAAIADMLDRWIISGACVGLVRGTTDFAGRALRLFQTGNLQTYAFLFALGVAVVLWLALKLTG
jgi:NADH-quinone oxidoreductase subunit L